MTLPPGLQAIRDDANAREARPYIERLPTVAQLNALLNLIEEMAGALEKITNPSVVKKPGSNCDCANCRMWVRAALDKYREFK